MPRILDNREIFTDEIRGYLTWHGKDSPELVTQYPCQLIIPDAGSGHPLSHYVVADD
jgi:hypothetical protein